MTDRPNLVRVSPERQTETAETTFRHESDQEVLVDRDITEMAATDALADAFGLSVGDLITHTVTRASEDGRPVSISDTYQPLGVNGLESATELEETLADRLPEPSHAEWLRSTPGDLVKTVRQRFLAADGKLVMISYISYQQGRYDAFLFRMPLRRDAPETGTDQPETAQP